MEFTLKKNITADQTMPFESNVLIMWISQNKKHLVQQTLNFILKKT